MLIKHECGETKEVDFFTLCDWFERGEDMRGVRVFVGDVDTTENTFADVAMHFALISQPSIVFDDEVLLQHASARAIVIANQGIAELEEGARDQERFEQQRRSDYLGDVL